MTDNVTDLCTLAVEDRHKRNDLTCSSCDSHVSTYNCNGSVIRLRPDAAGWDWWVSCDNAACAHSHGEGLFQNMPEWVKER